MKIQLLKAMICLSNITLIALLSACGQSLLTAPRLMMSEESWDFGEVKTDSEVKHTILIKNRGSAELTVYAYPGCPACMFIELDKYSIPPGGEAKLHIKIIETEAGPYNGFIMIDTNDPIQRQKQIAIKGTFCP